MPHWGSAAGRTLMDWDTVPLHIVKRLAVTVHRHGVPMFADQEIHEATMRYLPDVSGLLGPRYNFADVIRVCKENNWEYNAYKLRQRVHSGLKYDRWVDDELHKQVDAAYVEVTLQSTSKPTLQRNFSRGEVLLAIQTRGNYCYWCQAPFNDICLPVGDHFIPVAQGGLTVPWNCVPSCARCNNEKHDMMADQWRRILDNKLRQGRKGLVA